MTGCARGAERVTEIVFDVLPPQTKLAGER
jgi:hypothetical protein